MRSYQAVVISDVGALTLLVTPDARAGRVGINRLDVLKAYVESGGGLMLAGGYMGFQGSLGTAPLYDTAVGNVPCRYAVSLEGGLRGARRSPSIHLFPSHPILSSRRRSTDGTVKLTERWGISAIGVMSKIARDPLYHRHRFPAEVIAQAVWLYFRFPRAP